MTRYNDGWCGPDSSVVLHAPNAGEDLAALGQVPVPEAGADHVAAGGPGAAAQHLVGVAEEDLGVFGVWESLEARIRGEFRAGPLPNVAEHLDGAAGGRRIGVGTRGSASEGELVEVGALAVRPPSRGLPLALGREAL